MLPPVEIRFAVHVLIHRGEHVKPSSTGRLIARAVTDAACHLYQRETRFHGASGLPPDAVEPDCELWILHPGGEPLPVPRGASDASSTSQPHLLLLDGTWRQAGEMLRSVEGRGRCVRLPEASVGPSRYWLRDQPGPVQLSTAEALVGVFHALGEHEAAAALRLHFELHVYAMLLARGRREMAERYLGHSPLLAAMPDVNGRLQLR
jgi:DTW domain-containing protein YfiP